MLEVKENDGVISSARCSPLVAKAILALTPSSGRSLVRSRLSVPAGDGSTTPTNQKNKLTKPTFSLPVKFIQQHRRRRWSLIQEGIEKKKVFSRSDKHDYRNPESDYSAGDIAGILRRQTVELRRHHRRHPFLTRDFLRDLQSFGLLPTPSTDDEEDDEADCCWDEVLLNERSSSPCWSVGSTVSEEELRSSTANMALEDHSSQEDLQEDRYRSQLSIDYAESSTPKIKSAAGPRRSLRRRLRTWTSSGSPFRHLSSSFRSSSSHRNTKRRVKQS